VAGEASPTLAKGGAKLGVGGGACNAKFELRLEGSVPYVTCAAAGHARSVIVMRGNPDGSLSSAGRFATGLLSLRYSEDSCFMDNSQPCIGGTEHKVAAGVNPAAHPTLGRKV
jgi:hypothetical protein